MWPEGRGRRGAADGSGRRCDPVAVTEVPGRGRRPHGWPWTASGAGTADSSATRRYRWEIACAPGQVNDIVVPGTWAASDQQSQPQCIEDRGVTFLLVVASPRGTAHNCRRPGRSHRRLPLTPADAALPAGRRTRRGRSHPGCGALACPSTAHRWGSSRGRRRSRRRQDRVRVRVLLRSASGGRPRSPTAMSRSVGVSARRARP